MEQHVRLLMNSPSYWEVDVPVAAVADLPGPKVVVSGGHDSALEAISNETAKAIGAERLTFAGAGHVVQRAPDFNDLLRRIWTS